MTLGRQDYQQYPSRLSLGLGLRLTYARLADATTFAGRADVRGRTLEVDAPVLTALNAAVQVRLRLVGAPTRHPLTLGFNLDAAGWSFGPVRPALVSALAGASSADVRPVRGNLLLGNTRDRGTLNSEFYLSYRAAPRLTVRAGWAHMASGFELASHRYQRFDNLAFVGLSVGVGGVWRYY